jgi:L-cysteine:1D-myo-inositol 2-amino-2-deoxy-alpha-D-glucopyranoside ligase
VIARDGLGLPFDVQGGGVDLQFPHHEMSTSHARLLDDGRGAGVHVHAGMVGLDGEKMSKSRGNLVLVSKLRRAGVDPAAIRLAILAHHYRSDWSWTDGVLEEAVARLDRWRRAADAAAAADVVAVRDQIRVCLADDLDAPAALAAVDALAAAAHGSAGDAAARQGLADVVDALLGVRL